MIRRVTFLPSGRCLVDASVLTQGVARGRLERLPIWMYLIEASDGLFLVDSGMPSGCIGNPDYFRGSEDEGLIVPEMTEADHVTAVLARRRLQPSDVDALITTHLHFDHAGGQAAFADVPIVLHRDAWALGQAGRCLPECFPSGLVYRPIAGDQELAPGLHLLETPGHAAGHLSVLLRPVGERPLLLTIDAAYTRANWAGVPGAWADVEQARASLARLREIARDEDARVFFGHDAEQALEPQWRPYWAEWEGDDA